MGLPVLVDLVIADSKPAAAKVRGRQVLPVRSPRGSASGPETATGSPRATDSRKAERCSLVTLEKPAIVEGSAQETEARKVDHWRPARVGKPAMASGSLSARGPASAAAVHQASAGPGAQATAVPVQEAQTAPAQQPEAARSRVSAACQPVIRSGAQVANSASPLTALDSSIAQPAPSPSSPAARGRGPPRYFRCHLRCNECLEPSIRAGLAVVAPVAFQGEKRA